jgi:hypothetical protein
MGATVVVAAPGCCGASHVTTAPGAATTLLEQTGSPGSMPVADDLGALVDARPSASSEAAGLLDPLHDTARVLTHAGGIQNSA